MKIVLGLAAVVSLSAAAARAGNVSKGGCEAFDKGTEILGNITERYYGPEQIPENLHSIFLKRAAEDADAAANIAKARFKGTSTAPATASHPTTPSHPSGSSHDPGETGADSSGTSGSSSSSGATTSADCSKLKDVVDKFYAEYHDLAVKYKALGKEGVCVKFPDTGHEDDCLNQIGPLLDREKKDRDPAGVLGQFVDAVDKNPTCFSMSGLDGSTGEEGVGTERMLYDRMKKQQCSRDDVACKPVRVGKMREARVYLARAGKASPSTFSTESHDVALRKVYTDEVNPLLIKGEGGGCDNAGAGAEHLMWCSYTAGEDWDNKLLFTASAKVAKAFHAAKNDGLPICAGVLAD